MARVGRQLVEEKRAAILAEASVSGNLEKKQFKGKDILSVISKLYTQSLILYANKCRFDSQSQHGHRRERY